MKTETVAEFLARGGVITKCEPGPSKVEDKVHLAGAAKPTIISMEDAAVLYGEKNAQKEGKVKKAKPKAKVDLSLLPESLRLKLTARLSGNNDQ